MTQAAPTTTTTLQDIHAAMFQHVLALKGALASDVLDDGLYGQSLIDGADAIADQLQAIIENGGQPDL